MSPCRFTRLLFVLAVLSSSCDLSTKTCPALGWEDTLEVDFYPAPSAAGVWEIEFFAGFDATCAIDLPVEDVGEVEDSACESEHFMELDLNYDGASIRSVKLYRAPESVTLRVTHDGTVLLEQTLVPEYVVSEPAGPGCGEQFTGHITVNVPEP